MGPTTVTVETIVSSPLLSTCSTPAKVNSSAVMLTSISAVYGALAMSSASMKIGFAYPISSAKIAPRTTNCHGFSASVMGPPNARNSCQTTMRKRTAQAVYCMMSKALVMKGKYSSMVTMSVPNALRKRPETASMICEAILEIHVTIPSKIQSKIVVHLLSDPELLIISLCTARRRSTAAGMLR